MADTPDDIEMKDKRTASGMYDGMSEEDIKQEQLAQRVDAWGMSLAKNRAEAIAARLTSGIEERWREDEEFYEGIDDLNRGDERTVMRQKPPSSGSGLSSSKKNRTTRSRVFPNITGPFVDACAAHIADILLPTEDRPWSLEPTPIPEIEELADQYNADNPDQAKKQASKGLFAKIKDTFTGGHDRNEIEGRDDSLVSQEAGMSPEEAFKQRELAIAVAKATESRIWDWHVECQFTAEVRRCIEDAFRIGVGILKGPVPKNKQKLSWRSPEIEVRDGVEFEVPGNIEMMRDIAPGSKRIDPWNFFPAAGCGQNIQNGSGCWERDFITKKQLRDLKKDPSYMGFQIDRCLKEGPIRATATLQETSSLSNDVEMKDKYEIWYGYTTAEKEDLEAAGCDCSDLEGQDPHVEAIVTMVNNRAIRASIPPLDHGGYPYDVYCLRKRANYWAGIGMARQIRTAQKIVVGATRQMMDNAGLAGGPMIVFKQGVVRPADGVAGIGPRKVFYIAKDDQTIADATKAIGSVKVDMLVNEMMAIINYGLRLAEVTTGFPMMMQGQIGSIPDRVGVVDQLQTNTNAVKRRIARNFSDDLMNPHIRRYQIWHLMYGPDNEKGDLQVNVKGYAALVERDIQNQELAQMYAIVTDPRFGLDPRKWAKEYLRSKHFDAIDLEFDDDEWEQMLQQWQQMLAASAEDPRIAVAQINAQARLEDRAMQEEGRGAVQISKQQHEAEQKELDRQIALINRAFDKELKVLDQLGMTKVERDKLKARLAEKVMDINSTFRLANLKAPASALPKPAFEPPGKAPKGESFQK